MDEPDDMKIVDRKLNILKGSINKFNPEEIIDPLFEKTNDEIMSIEVYKSIDDTEMDSQKMSKIFEIISKSKTNKTFEIFINILKGGTKEHNALAKEIEEMDVTKIKINTGKSKSELMQEQLDKINFSEENEISSFLKKEINYSLKMREGQISFRAQVPVEIFKSFLRGSEAEEVESIIIKYVKAAKETFKNINKIEIEECVKMISSYEIQGMDWIKKITQALFDKVNKNRILVWFLFWKGILDRLKSHGEKKDTIFILVSCLLLNPKVEKFLDSKSWDFLLQGSKDSYFSFLSDKFHIII